MGRQRVRSALLAGGALVVAVTLLGSCSNATSPIIEICLASAFTGEAVVLAEQAASTPGDPEAAERLLSKARSSVEEAKDRLHRVKEPERDTTWVAAWTAAKEVTVAVQALEVGDAATANESLSRAREHLDAVAETTAEPCQGPARDD